MPLPANRSVVIISGLLTLLVLGGGTLAVALHDGWLRTAAADVPNRETLTASTQPTPDGNNLYAAGRPTGPSSQPSIRGAVQDEVGVHRQKLEEVYRALDDAYVQIRALQSPQAQLASARNDDDGFTEHDGDDERRGRRSDRRRSRDD
jgi:hypothetical protein